MLCWIEAFHSKGLNINPLRKLPVKDYLVFLIILLNLNISKCN